MYRLKSWRKNNELLGLRAAWTMPKSKQENKKCSRYQLYDYSEHIISFFDVAKILGISERTLYRRLKRNENAVLRKLKEKGKTFQIIRTEKGVRVFKENKGDEK